MKLCADCDGPLCDFCCHYEFNGEERLFQLIPDEEPRVVKVYTGAGFCRLHGEHRDPEDACNEFVCMNVVEKENA